MTGTSPLVLFTFLFFTQSLTAETGELPPITVRPSEISPAGPSRTIDRREIEERPQGTLADLLRNQAGIDVLTSGGPGQPSFVFIRGGKSEHTLVLIDGMDVNDPTTTARIFDFANLPLNGIEKIEIYRGARGVRFGPDAIGGVINIVTKKGDGPAAAVAAIEAGSYRTANGSLEASGSAGDYNYSLGHHRLQTGGFSAADAGRAAEKDGFERRAWTARLGSKLGARLDLDFHFRNLIGQTELDHSGGPAGDDPNYTSRSNQSLAGSRLTWNGRKISSALSLHSAFNERSYDNLPDAVHPAPFREDFHSRAWRGESLTAIALPGNANIEIGLLWRSEEASSTTAAKQRQSSFGQSAAYQLKFGEAQAEVGIRHDEVDAPAGFSVFTGAAAASYDFFSKRTRLGASWNSGFKNPSLFQLHSSFGSTALQPERSRTWDLSARHRFNFAEIELVYFANRYRELIDFDFAASKYRNVGAAYSRGAELTALASIAQNLTFKLAGTYLSARDENDGRKLLRRPAQSYAAELRWAKGKMKLHAAYRWKDAREDVDPVSFQRIELAPYDVASAGTAYEISAGWSLFARVENIFDRAYQEVAGFNTSRRAYYGGLSVIF